MRKLNSGGMYIIHINSYVTSKLGILHYVQLFLAYIMISHHYNYIRASIIIIMQYIYIYIYILVNKKFQEIIKGGIVYIKRKWRQDWDMNETL